MQNSLFDDDFLPDSQQETLEDYRDTFDSSNVVLYSTDWTVGSVIEQIKKKRIDLNPSFQRRQAWSVKHRSQFIESLILSIPIPQIVLAEDPTKKGFYIVIDGKQRLLSLAQYVQNEPIGESKDESHFEAYKLSGLEVLGASVPISGLYFYELPTDIRAQIENTVLRTVIIRSVNNRNFLYEAFLRLNQGSKPLSPQELRQALAPGKFTDWLDNFVSHSTVLQEALRIKDVDPRMRDTEVALRFMAYQEALDGYDGNFKFFLDQYTIDKNKQGFSPSLAETLENALTTTMCIFDKNAFEKYDPKSKEFTGKFNRAVFDCMTFFFADPQVSEKAKEKKHEVVNAFKSLCTTSTDYMSSIETSFKNVSETSTRLQLWGQALSGVIGMPLPQITSINSKVRVQK